MDPFSITAASVSLTLTVGQVTSSITQFVRQVKDAKRDMDLVSDELRAIPNTLGSMSSLDSSIKFRDLPSHLRDQFQDIMEDCRTAVEEIGAIMKRYQFGHIQTIR
jgi:hypothetical protein